MMRGVAHSCGTTARVVALAVALATTSLQGCRQGTTDLPAVTGPVVRIQHVSGLFVEVPPALAEAQLTQAGIRLRPVGAASLRRPWTIDLSLVPGPGLKADGTRDWASGGRTLHQAPVRSSEGGSGGSLHTVDAWFSCGSNHVAARLQQQAEEASEVDLSAAWQLALTAGCVESAASRR